MYMVWTRAGREYITANPFTPPAFDWYNLGAAFGYTPDDTQTALRGAVVYSAVPTSPHVINDTLYQISFTLDRSLPQITFGEVGFYLNGVLFAVAASGTAEVKGADEALTFDAFLDTSNTSYLLYAQVSSSNRINVPFGGTVDALPPAHLAPNAMIVQSPVSPTRSLLATNMGAAWSIAGYEVVRNSGVISNMTASLELRVTSLTTAGYWPTISYQGQLLVQFKAGAAAGVIRVVKGIVPIVGTQEGYVLLHTGFLPDTQPVAGDTFDIIAQTNEAGGTGFQRQLVDQAGAPIPGGTPIATLAQLYGILQNYRASGTGSYTDAFGTPLEL